MMVELVSPSNGGLGWVSLKPIEAERYEANDAMVKELMEGLNRLVATMHEMNTEAMKYQ